MMFLVVFCKCMLDLPVIICFLQCLPGTSFPVWEHRPVVGGPNSHFYLFKQAIWGCTRMPLLKASVAETRRVRH